MGEKQTKMQQVNHCLQYGLASTELISLDEPLVKANGEDDDWDVLGNFISGQLPSLEEQYVARKREEMAERLLQCLSEKHRKVISHRFGIDILPDGITDNRCVVDEREATLEQVGEVMGLSRERIRQIEKEGLERLRSYIFWSKKREQEYRDLISA